MSEVYKEGKEFFNEDFSEHPLEKGDYEDCIFKNCSLAGTDLSDIVFIECTFEQCDLSNVDLKGTAFRDITFASCKMLGLHFEVCNEFLFEVKFRQCQLNMSSFYERNLQGCSFDSCSLVEVDFGEADLTKASFKNCDLSGASFEYTKLEQADFRTANNYVINPEINQIKKARFSSQGLAGLLTNYDIIIEY